MFNPNPGPQLAMWKGPFGNAYTRRNKSNSLTIFARSDLWGEILTHIGIDGSNNPDTILEVGAGSGANLQAISLVYGNHRLPVTLWGTEPNDEARTILESTASLATPDTAENLASFAGGCADLVFTSGVLIHIPPERRPLAMREIYRCSKRWIVAIEYFNDKPISIPYRDTAETLFKADFGSEYMDLFPTLECAAYGFKWKRMSNLDNVTWWLLDKGTVANED